MFAVTTSTSVCQAQALQTYQGTQAFNTMIGYISGTEKYSYVIDENGDKLYQGAYSFTGNKSLSSETAQISGKHTINTNFKKNKLDGAYTTTASYVGKNWSYARGWQPYTASTKLTAVFANGNPNGTFTASYKGDMNYSGCATLKNGKYIGTYKYSGPGDNHSLWEIRGQLTTDGKLTGNWVVQNLVADWSANYTFLNDVLIGGGNMTPQIQNLSKQFAERKISEKEIVKKGYVIANNSLPLQFYIDYLILIDDDYGLNQLDGWDFSAYGPKIFKQILLVNAFTEEGFNYICEKIRMSTNSFGLYAPNRDLICEFTYTKHDDGLISLKCDKDFAMKYGTHPELAERDDYYQYIYLTSSQFERFETLLENVAIANCKNEIIPGLSDYKKDKVNAENTITYEKAKNASSTAFTESDRKLYKQYDRFLNKINTETAYSYQFSSDSSYLLKKHFSGSTEAIRMNLEGVEEYYEWLQKQHAKALFCDEQRDEIIKRLGNIRKYEYGSYEYARYNIFYGDILNKIPNPNSYLQPEITLNMYFYLTNKGIELLNICDSLLLTGKILENKLPNKAYDSYKKQEDTYMDCYIPNGYIKFDDFYKNVLKLKELQDNYLQWIEGNEKVTQVHVKINNDCSNKYYDICIAYNNLYKSIYNPSPIITDSNSANNEFQRIVELSNIQEKFIDYINQRILVENLNSEIVEKCDNTSYSDILKPWQNKYKKSTVITKDVDKSLSDIENIQKIGNTLLKYISLREQCDSNSTAIISMCGKQYSDLVKPYQAKMKGMTYVPDMASKETLDNDYTTLSEYVSYQKDLLKYIQNRQKVDQLNQSILEKIGKAKNVKKLYGVFYKTLSINWLADSDNFRTIEETVSLLQKTEAALQSNGADSFDGLLKKAKTAEDFKKVLNL